MTKEMSGPSSAAGSPRFPPSFENGDGNEGSGSEVPQLNTSPLSPPPPDVLSTSSSTKTQDERLNASDVDAAESQPMATSDSNSSNLPTKDSAGAALSSAAPYGTRSRNRAGISRPNYAEDKEIDAELEIASPAKDNNAGRKMARGPDVGVSGAPDVGKSSNPARKSHNLEADQIATVQSYHHKDPIPGTSTFSAKPAATTVSNISSKKRKAGSQYAATPFSQTPGQAPPVQVITRRASMAAQVAGGPRQSNMVTFENCRGQLQGKKLTADDGTDFQVNDHVYLVCEPPGEPYYLGRIMEFLHINNDNTQPIDALRLNWYYRPKDIGRRVNDTRQVFASMHSDINPLTALRGKCDIKHKSEVDKIDDLRKKPDCFWYDKLYDRYIHRFYDVIPTKQVINVPMEVKKVLDERWKYIVVEPGRGRELTSAVKSCKRCNKYCASNDSVDCAVCRSTYHMSCVNPPLLKKPSRGFAWACGPCSKAQEKKLEARNTPIVTEATGDVDDGEYNDEEYDSPTAADDPSDTSRTSSTGSGSVEVSIHPGTAEQIHQASLWLFRYLGIHCKVEDALDYDDRIYPRASSRLGPRHQANVPAWPGRPVVYVKPTEIKRKYVKGSGYKKDTKLSKDTVTALEAEKLAREKRPKWVMDEPPGYVHRGEDYDNDDPNNTAQLLYKLPSANELPHPSIKNANADNTNDTGPLNEAAREQLVFNYVWRAKDVAQPLYGLPEKSTNVLDVALQTLRLNGYNTEKALQAMSTLEKKVFKEPELTSAELKRFEDGVAKYGSEWHSIKKHVKTVSAANIVRFYYTWKKTERGQHIWENYSGRKGKKEAKRAEASAGKLQDDVADEYDDSAFDNDKALQKKRGFECKFCNTKTSRQWRRAPNTAPGTMTIEITGTKPSGKDKGSQSMVALCWRCAELWRRYAIQWEDIEEVAKKVAQAGGRAWRRKIDEELLKELVTANEIIDISATATPSGPASGGGTPTPAFSAAVPAVEPPKKKIKGLQERESSDVTLDSGSGVSTQKKKTVQEKPAGPPPAPEIPKPRLLPCAICGEMDPMGDQHLTCKECRLTVHRNCYGAVSENRNSSKWTCDMCSNDKNPQVSIQYKCMLCPVEYTEHDFVEPPKATTTRKKHDKERDRLERETAQKVANIFRKKQEELNKPVNPREPLKRTANNNWVHVTCAVFTPEVKFGNAKALEPSEGIPSIPSARYDEICKACKQKGGACVGCHSCRASVHVECAHQAGYILGFDIAPVKGSRRDQFNIVNINGEVGTMTAAIWCKEHVPTKTIVHQMQDIVDDTGLNALQLYIQNFKQADLTLTGTVRKATLVNQSTKVINPISIAAPANRRASAAMASNGYAVGDSPSTSTIDVSKICATCGIDVSPKWWPFPHVSTTANASTQPNGDQASYSRSPRVEGQPVEEDGGSHAALAAAALHQNTHPLGTESIESQCHKCHWKKVQKEESLVAPEVQQVESRPPPTLLSSVNVPTPDADIARTLPQYTWPPPPSYPPNGSYSSWSHHPPPPPQTGPLVNQINGSHSPRITTAAQPLAGQGSARQSLPGIPHSPHQSNHARQASNGYPPSPHRILGPSTHIQNGTYTSSYASTCPPPQHLTNGGPPPRAPEQPFSHSVATMHSRPPYVPPQTSPPMLHGSHPQPHDNSLPQPPTIRQADGRVNGGASASPSLRNLLS